MRTTLRTLLEDAILKTEGTASPLLYCSYPLDEEFCDGWGGDEGDEPQFTAYTNSHVYYQGGYDGATWVCNSSRAVPTEGNLL